MILSLNPWVWFSRMYLSWNVRLKCFEHMLQNVALPFCDVFKDAFVIEFSPYVWCSECWQRGFTAESWERQLRDIERVAAAEWTASPLTAAVTDWWRNMDCIVCIHVEWQDPKIRCYAGYLSWEVILVSYNTNRLSGSKDRWSYCWKAIRLRADCEIFRLIRNRPTSMCFEHQAGIMYFKMVLSLNQLLIDPVWEQCW